MVIGGAKHMKQINNNCVEVLPSLLNKTKVQTIRKAWRVITTAGIQARFFPEIPTTSISPKYKVGETVEIVWTGDINRTAWKWLPKGSQPILGKAIITEVFEIEIRKNSEYQFRYIHSDHWWSQEGGRAKELSECDGFKSAKQMFEYFNKNYNLSTPKKFHVYRWRWLK